MDARQQETRHRTVAAHVQQALHTHTVNPDHLDDTVLFLAHVIGGMLRMLSPAAQHEDQINALREEIAYGIAHWTPAE